MTASFLRASLFTSVVAFGVATLVAGLGVLFILLGLGFLGIVRRLDERVPRRRAAGRTGARRRDLTPRRGRQPRRRSASSQLGRPSEPRIVQRTNFVGPISGARADIISR